MSFNAGKGEPHCEKEVKQVQLGVYVFFTCSGKGSSSSVLIEKKIEMRDK